MFKTKIHYKNERVEAIIKPYDDTKKKFLKEWSNSVLRATQNPPFIRESIDLADLALSKWKARKQKDNYVNTVAELKQYISDNSNVEVAFFLTLETDSLPGTIICVSHIRRTWCNNIYIDFLASHPKALSEESEIKGAGRAMLHCISTIANEINSPLIWGEATHLSWQYYKKVFGLRKIKDVLIIPRKNYLNFLDVVNKKM